MATGISILLILAAVVLVLAIVFIAFIIWFYVEQKLSIERYVEWLNSYSEE